MRMTLAAAWCLLAVGTPAVAGDLTPEAVRAALPKLDAIVGDVLARSAVPGIAVAIVFGDEGQGWLLMSPEAWLAHPRAVPHFKSRVRAGLAGLAAAGLRNEAENGL